MLFLILYSDVELIDETTLHEWRDRGTVQLGKGNAVQSLKDFFDWLEYAEPESDSD